MPDLEIVYIVKRIFLVAVASISSPCSMVPNSLKLSVTEFYFETGLSVNTIFTVVFRTYINGGINLSFFN